MDKTISDRKIAANRENASKSTGPRTERGKAIASLNAMVHGIFAKKTVAVGPPFLEDPAEFAAILESLRLHYEPVGVLEELKVEEIASLNWKKVRLERYETAGISERLFATIEASRRRRDEESFDSLEKGVALGSSEDRPDVTAAQLQKQVNLVHRLRAVDVKIDEEPDFLAFLWFEKFAMAEEAPPAEHKKSVEQFKTLIAGLPPAEMADLRNRFQSKMEDLLQTMWDLRAKTVPFEAAIERSLIPDAAEMNKTLRYAAQNSRLEEKAVDALEHLQAARREKEGRSR